MNSFNWHFDFMSFIVALETLCKVDLDLNLETFAKRIGLWSRDLLAKSLGLGLDTFLQVSITTQDIVAIIALL